MSVFTHTFSGLVERAEGILAILPTNTDDLNVVHSFNSLLGWPSSASVPVEITVTVSTKQVKNCLDANKDRVKRLEKELEERNQ